MAKKTLLFLLCAFVLVSCLTLPRNPLQTDDAANYALMVKNAVIHNYWLAQFVTPGDPASFMDKPPLGLWLLAWLPKLIGLNELTVHIPNVMYYALTLLLLYFSLARLNSRKLALYSTALAATSLCLVVYSRAPKLDIPLTLAVLIAHLSLYAYLQKERPLYLLPFSLALAAGFLIKSGFGLLLPALTVLFLLFFNPTARKKIFSLCLTRYALLSAGLFLAVVGGVLALQIKPLGAQFIPYLKSITITSKYNTGYLGLGFYYSIVGFLLVAVFPWTPLALTALKFDWRRLNLNTFCNVWFWSNFLFLLFCYKQTDLRTFTPLVPPLAILAGTRLVSMKERRGFLWSLFFLVVFGLILVAGILNPVNAQGNDLSAAIAPVACFVVALAFIAFFCFKPSPTYFTVCFALVALSYSVLFYNTKPLVEASNPDRNWPAAIRAERAKGAKFFIYRPPDRNLFYSPDLCWVDFMAGPADQYFWNGQQLKDGLKKGKAVVLSDTHSWDKLKATNFVILGKDNYSSLIRTR